MIPTKLKFKARILHVLSQVEITGAETYAATLANAQVAQGHEVFIISDTFKSQTSAKVISIPIANRRWLSRFKNLLAVRKFVRENKIDFVHAHSRAASWVCYYGLKNTRVPLISTVHGRQHIHRSSKGKDIYGERIVAVCENIKTHLVSELFLSGRKIAVVPNVFEFHKPPPPRQNSNKVVSIIGRATGPKGERAAQIISRIAPKLLNDYPDLKFQVVGGDWEKFSDEAREIMQAPRARFTNRIEFRGFVSDIEKLISESTLVIGSGRVAIETLWLKVPLIAMGESLTPGLVIDPEDFSALASNFGDCSALAANVDTEIDAHKIERDIRSCLDQNAKIKSDELSQKVFERFNLSSVLSQIEEIYLQARMLKAHPRHIPNLMYHKVPEQPIETRHRIFVTKSLFEKQMRVLARAGFTALTFKEYDEFRTGARPIAEFPRKPVFITFDDGYIDNLTNALPIVKSQGLNFTLFILGDSALDHNSWDTINGDTRSNIMSLGQKQSLIHQGVEIGAHSMSHRDMTKLSDQENLLELEQSKKILERELGLREEILVYAYPFGHVNDHVKDLTRQAGYKYAVATDTGGLHLEDDPFQIFRVNIFPEDRGFRFWKKIQPWYRAHYFKKRGR